MVTETTIRQTRFNPDGVPLANRIRRVMQYANTIDDAVKELTTKNNGLYANEWLIGDANTNEIAMLELGTNAWKLHRSSKNEWLNGGMPGFYWGCNNAKDRADVIVYLNTMGSNLPLPAAAAPAPAAGAAPATANASAPADNATAPESNAAAPAAKK